MTIKKILSVLLIVTAIVPYPVFANSGVIGDTEPPTSCPEGMHIDMASCVYDDTIPQGYFDPDNNPNGGGYADAAQNPLAILRNALIALGIVAEVSIDVLEILIIDAIAVGIETFEIGQYTVYLELSGVTAEGITGFALRVYTRVGNEYVITTAIDEASAVFRFLVPLFSAAVRAHYNSGGGGGQPQGDW